MDTTKTAIETNMDKSHKNMTYHAKNHLSMQTRVRRRGMTDM